MPPQPRRYRLKDIDVEHAKSWIEARVIATGACRASAAAAFKKLGFDPAKLQTWCDCHLSAPEWRRLQAAIRSRRRDTTAGVHVRLTVDAYRVLQARAKREDVTLSEAVLRLALAPVPAPSARPDAGAVRIKKYREDQLVHEIECGGESIGCVMPLDSGRWIAWLHDGKTRAEGNSAQKAANAVVRKGRVTIAAGAGSSEQNRSDPSDPFEHVL